MAGGETRFLINGRFLSRPMTGVDRSATNLVRAMAGAAGYRALAFDVAVPTDAPSDAVIRERLSLPETSRILRSTRKGYLWEQLDLAFLQPQAMLLSLCNMGPVIRRNQFLLLHDAQVFDVPESYSRVFRLAYCVLWPCLGRRVAHLASVSAHSRARLLHHGIGAGRSVDILPNGADHILSVEEDRSVLDLHGLRAGEYLLAIGSPARHKNIAMLARACERRADRSVPLVIAGGGNRRVFSDADILASDGLCLIGRVTDAELKALYRHARLFLFPSLTEGFGLPAAEAMACGCPVIASSGGAIPEVCGDAAVICDPLDEALWTRTIGELQVDEGRRAALAMAGRERIARFTWDAAARRLLELAGTAAVMDAPRPAPPARIATSQARG